MCAVCGLLFTWSKKWARCWSEGRYWPESCQRHRRIERWACT
ncbi:MAG: DUF2256 domain-containing protein [Pseudomonas sp.]